MKSVWICSRNEMTRNKSQFVTNLSVSLDAAVCRDRLYVQVSQQGLFYISVAFERCVCLSHMLQLAVVSCHVFYFSHRVCLRSLHIFLMRVSHTEKTSLSRLYRNLEQLGVKRDERRPEYLSFLPINALLASRGWQFCIALFTESEERVLY